jgi:hypothetical protein
MNDTSWKVQESPPLPLLALDREQWDKNQLVPWTGKDPKWVDIVVNNIDFTGHPFCRLQDIGINDSILTED